MSDPTSVELSIPVIDGELSSVNFFNGRLLVSGDLKAEQESRKLAVQRVGQVVGQGVVEGLRVGLLPSATSGSLALGIDAGTALNRQGAVLKLASSVRLEIVAPVERIKANLARASFIECAPELRRFKPPRNLLGFQILVARPDTLEKGRAPLVAMDMSAAGCNIDRIAQAIRFDLVPVQLSLPKNISPESPALRNVVAHLLQNKALTESGDGVPLALLRFDASGRLDFLDMWSVRRRVSRGLPGSLPSHPATVDATSWSQVFGPQTESVGEARILQFQDQLAQALLQKLPLAGSGIESIEPLMVQDVFPHLPPAGLLPKGFMWRDFLGETEIGASEPPVIDADVADALLREAASRPGSDAVALNRKGEVKPLKVYRIADTEQHLFVRTQDARQWASETVFDETRIGPKGFPAKTDSGHASVQSALEDLYAKLQAKLPYQQAASDVKVDKYGSEIDGNVQNSLQNLSRWMHAGMDSLHESESVQYDGSSVDAPSGSVKSALDGLHQRVRALSGLAHVLTPADWTERLGSLPNARGEAPTATGRQDLNLFFEAGVFQTVFPVVLSGYGHVRIQGAGVGTLLVASGAESALVVRDCLSCTVLDIALQSTGAIDRTERIFLREEGRKPRDIKSGLGGALSLVRVPDIHLERVKATSLSASLRASCGISVHNTGLEVDSRVVVRDCSIETGDEQVGLLVSDSSNVSVSDCVVVSTGRAVAASSRRRSHAATLLARHFLDLATSPPSIAPTTGPVSVAAAATPVRTGLRDLPVLTPPIRIPRVIPRLEVEWKQWIPGGAWDWARGVAGKDTDETKLFRRFLERTTEALRDGDPLSDSFLSSLRMNFLKNLASLPAVASRGIVVAGQIPTTARIEANRVSGASVGILVGLSRSGTVKDRHDRILAKRLSIVGNEVSIPDLRGRPGQSAGIQIGNAEDVTISDNTVEVDHQSWWDLPLEAVRAWGQFGRRLDVRGNRASGHQSGIWIRPLAPQGTEIPKKRTNPWKVSDNLCEGAKSAVNILDAWSVLFHVEDNFS